jgi:serine/threonine protein kinase
MEFVEENNQSMTVYKVLYDPTAEKTKLGMSIANWLRICYDIADGLDHMHQKGYLHCDLKTNKVLISKKKGYVIDFGKVCRITHSSAKKYKEVFSHIAPEVLQGSPATTASDVYSSYILFGKISKVIAQEVNSTVLLQLGKTATIK